MKIMFGTGSKFGLLKEEKAKLLVNYAIESGINNFDTGINYGNWKSLPLLGKCLSIHLKKGREMFTLTSKAGTHSKSFFNSYKDFDPEHIENMINKSIRDLKCFYLDTFYLHGPSLEEIETKGLLKTLKKLLQQRKIRNIGVNSHDLITIEKISTGYYEEINSLMIDYNLLQQDRFPTFSKCIKSNISIAAGTSLLQGLLLESPFSTFLKKKSFFHLAKLTLRKSSKRFISPAKIARKYIKSNYPNDFDSIPLSFVLNNPSISSIPIGMLSKESIKKNVTIEKKTTPKIITDNVGKWCLKNCQVYD